MPKNDMAVAPGPRPEAETPRLDPGRRLTRQRRLVWQTIQEIGPHCTAEQVTASVKQANPRVARSTVYRILADLCSAGDVVVARLDAGGLRYELAAAEHPHAVCQVCGKVIHVGDELLETFEEHLAATVGFRTVRIDLTVNGVCRDCAAPSRRATRRQRHDHI
ncbi:MAG: transcriptional repressor [Candidatus Dormibacteraeota bacterium]|nr:transcriptional repressor [Candidatus Dormibacteraeota bacterium]